MDGRPTRTNGIQASEASKAMAENHHDLAAHIENFSLSEANAADVKSNHLPGLHHNAEHKNDNGYSKTTALTEINHNTVASVNETSSKKDSCNGNDAMPTVESKKVSITEPGEEEAGGDPSIERVPAEGEDQDEGPEDDKDAQIGIGTKKKKKKKPKSKRGLVIFQALAESDSADQLINTTERPHRFRGVLR